jgi:HK97 family phage prohead protease
MNKMFSVLTIKSVDEASRTLRGVATTPTPDRMGDIIEPLGVTFKNPTPLLWQHRADEPVGFAHFEKPTKKGINFEAEIAQIDEPGDLKNRLDMAWQSVKAKLVRGVSIGFRSIEYALMDNGGLHFLETEVLELSLVTIPANEDATITSIKAYAAKDRGAIRLVEIESVRLPNGAVRLSK